LKTTAAVMLAFSLFVVPVTSFTQETAPSLGVPPLALNTHARPAYLRR
jgi:hypothetical protein